MQQVATNRLKEILNNFEGKEVIVVGDIMLDHFIKGSVSRISPEAPVPVVDVKKEFFVAGGAGNVAVNLAALGAKPVMISVVGQDLGGEMLKGFLREASVLSNYAAGIVVGKSGTATATRTEIEGVLP